MTYKIILESKAKKFLLKLGTITQKRIINKIEILKINPFHGIPLTGNFKGLYKLRTGDIRFIYKIDNQNLVIVGTALGYRKNIYN